uniref:Uncharacterized protein n=1 Tax=Arundo donax TaxID=35708 RepID=A0A0A9HVB4_ARUDO
MASSGTAAGTGNGSCGAEADAHPRAGSLAGLRGWRAGEGPWDAPWQLTESPSCLSAWDATPPLQRLTCLRCGLTVHLLLARRPERLRPARWTPAYHGHYTVAALGRKHL